MDKEKIFHVKVSRWNPFGANTPVEITLPATFYELEDALEKARISDDIIYSSDILTCELEYLPRFIDIDANLHELNHLAHRLSALSEWELDCFEGMVMMDAIQTEHAPIPVERLINMTRSMEHCQIAYEAHDDASLGKFYVDNGFMPELETLPEKMLPWLHYAKIGKEMREGEGGVFIPHGYVVQNGEIAKTYQGGDAIPLERPDYMILLQIRKGYSSTPQLNNNLVSLLELPTDDAKVFQAVKTVGAESLQECTLRMEDCIAPRLSELITDELVDCDGNITAIGSLALQLERLDREGQLPVYKALLEVAPKNLTLDEAVVIAEHAVDFQLLREPASPLEYARTELERHDIPLKNVLLESGGLHHYGGKLMEAHHAVSTDYGILLTPEGMTVEQCLARPEQGHGMEMK